MSNNYFLRVKRGVSFAPQATAPATAKKGDLYFDNTLNLLQVYNGTTWESVGKVPETLTIGSGLTGGSYNGTTPVTITFDSSDATFKVTDSVDNTKEFKIDVAGNTGTSTTLLTSQTGNITLTLPNVTDTIVTKTTSDIFENKTFDTAATGNVLKINGTQITAVTGSGSAVLATSPTLTTPILGAATATSVTGSSSANLVLDSSPTYDVVLKNNGTTTATITSTGLLMDSGKTLTLSVTGNRALTSNASGIVTASSVTDTELGYVSGVSSAIQTQINGKQATLVSGTNINTVNGNSLLGSTDVPFVLPYAQISMYAANPNSAAFSTFNAPTLTATGTAAVKLTNNPISTPGYYSSKVLMEYTGTAVSSSSISGWRQLQTQYYIGAVQYGGVRLVSEFGFNNCFASGGINRRFFIGFTRVIGAPTDTDPSTQFSDFFGIGFDKNDAQWQFMSNDGGGAATKVALGASFARPSTDPSDIYRVELIAPKNSSTITYILTNLSTGATVSGTANTNLPSPTVGNFALIARSFISAGAVSTTATAGYGYIYIEQY